MENFISWLLKESYDIDSDIEKYLQSEIGKSNEKNDCKTVTRAFIKWAEENGIKANVLLLAPPSAKTIQQRPELKGKSGSGDSHMMPVINGKAIDFTVRQFPGQTRSYDQPLITPIQDVPKVYKELGGYFTYIPEYFKNGKSYFIGPWNKLPSFFGKDFHDELM